MRAGGFGEGLLADCEDGNAAVADGAVEKAVLDWNGQVGVDGSGCEAADVAARGGVSRLPLEVEDVRRKAED